ncbi:ABC transporter permease [Halobacillus sp. A1]|uniref:ABC transporter permease n=1 Tax=Halobacillus sp. A1 TaxID=2880262 RepID=UPI0020A6CFD9|nr:ABC transporter permease [Halobacillus sp. A1]MCP3033054.1 ABC transporter permease [Halobacillus sp. A1]
MENNSLEKSIKLQKRPPKASPMSAALTFAWRALLRIRYVPEQLFDVTVFPIIFLLMFTYLFGGAISGSTGEYLDFVLPGILVMTVAMITMYTGLDLNKDIEKGVFDRFRSLPIWQPAVLVGALLVDVVRYSLAATIMITLGYILGFRAEAGFSGIVLAVLVILFFSFSLSWIWTMLGIIVRSEKALMAISMMLLFPLTFLSSVFVDPSTMPNWLQHFVDINPITFVVDASRGLIHGYDVTSELLIITYISVGLIAVFGTLTMYFFRNKN